MKKQTKKPAKKAVNKPAPKTSPKKVVSKPAPKAKAKTKPAVVKPLVAVKPAAPVVIKPEVKPPVAKPVVATKPPVVVTPAPKPVVPAKPVVAVKPTGKAVPQTPTLLVGAKKPAVVIPIAGGKPIVVPSPKIQQNGITRPRPTDTDGKPKITHRVWKIADEISAKKAQLAAEESKQTGVVVKAKPATRQEVLVACSAEQIGYSNFSNHFYRWRKFNGLFGRIKKDGTKAACTGGPRKYTGFTEKPKPAPKPPLTTIPALPPIPSKKPTAKPLLSKPVGGAAANPVGNPGVAPFIPKPAVVVKPSQGVLPFAVTK